MCLIANNHIYDNGDSGLQTTMKHIDEKGLIYTGIRKNTEEKPYQIQEINGVISTETLISLEQSISREVPIAIPQDEKE